MATGVLGLSQFPIQWVPEKKNADKFYKSVKKATHKPIMPKIYYTTLYTAS
jgi:hypothetical protein